MHTPIDFGIFRSGEDDFAARFFGYLTKEFSARNRGLSPIFTPSFRLLPDEVDSRSLYYNRLVTISVKKLSECSNDG